ncbi:MAG: alpha-E domain-containing protein [Oscillospiraceae bacterium]|nr:alpha-E domain-containing protein [Oscillospiraceae bacterium]
MGIITVERMDNLFWLGRYIERVYATLKTYIDSYDKLIDTDRHYEDICEVLGIPDTYGSRGAFIYGFGYDKSNSYSIISNLNRAYDNAMVMRDEIGTDTLSYIHLAISEMESAATSDAPIISLQRVIDNILAFWGCLDDEIEDEGVRNTVKVGKRIERLDMYLRLKRSRSDLQREVRRLEHRLVTTNLSYNKAALMHVAAMIEDEPIDYSATLDKTFMIF